MTLIVNAIRSHDEARKVKAVARRLKRQIKRLRGQVPFALRYELDDLQRRLVAWELR